MTIENVIHNALLATLQIIRHPHVFRDAPLLSHSITRILYPIHVCKFVLDRVMLMISTRLVFILLMGFQGALIPSLLTLSVANALKSVPLVLLLKPQLVIVLQNALIYNLPILKRGNVLALAQNITFL